MKDEGYNWCYLCHSYHLTANDVEAHKSKPGLREWALALQSLTPGGSEYVGEPQRCIEHEEVIILMTYHMKRFVLNAAKGLATTRLVGLPSALPATM
jgi:hypothetical protein